jgi:hypothetical protein
MFVCLMVFNATFNNISVLFVEENRGPGENHKTLSHNAIHITLIEIRTHNTGGDMH